MNKSDVRTAIASSLGVTPGSYTCKVKCNGLLKIVTTCAEKSVQLIAEIAKLTGLEYFQVYGVDGNDSEGSTFVIGGSEAFVFTAKEALGVSFSVSPY